MPTTVCSPPIIGLSTTSPSVTPSFLAPDSLSAIWADAVGQCPWMRFAHRNGSEGTRVADTWIVSTPCRMRLMASIICSAATTPGTCASAALTSVADRSGGDGSAIVTTRWALLAGRASWLPSELFSVAITMELPAMNAVEMAMAMSVAMNRAGWYRTSRSACLSIRPPAP